MATTTTPDGSPNANVKLDDTQFNVDHGLLKLLDEPTPQLLIIVLRERSCVALNSS
jgi:hypothetical protein